MKDWKDEIISSANKLESATPPDGTFAKIQQRIQKDRLDQLPVNRNWLAVAASVALLVVGNLYFIYSSKQIPQSKETSVYSQLTSDYNIYANDNE